MSSPSPSDSEASCPAETIEEAPIFLTLDTDPQSYRALTLGRDNEELSSLEPPTWRSITVDDVYVLRQDSMSDFDSFASAVSTTSRSRPNKELYLSSAAPVMFRAVPPVPEWIEPFSSFTTTDGDVLVKIETALIRSGITCAHNPLKHKIKGTFQCANAEIGNFTIYLYQSGDNDKSYTVEVLRRSGDCLSFYALYRMLQESIRKSVDVVVIKQVDRTA